MAKHLTVSGARHGCTMLSLFYSSCSLCRGGRASCLPSKAGCAQGVADERRGTPTSQHYEVPLEQLSAALAAVWVRCGGDPGLVSQVAEVGRAHPPQ